MTVHGPAVEEARERADEARERMMQTLRELQQKIAPKTLAHEAWEGAKSKGADLAEDAVDAVRRRPIATTGAVAAIAMFLAREPLMDAVGKLWNGKSKPKPTTRTSKGPRRGPRKKTEAVQ